MSGHSKWASIKHKKALTDAKKSKIFSKVAAMITVAAREKGGDPRANPKLRLAIEKARSVNMPQENIERAIKRGTGQLPGIKLEEAVYEAYGPQGIAIIVKAITDNKNRTLAEIKHILTEHNGKLAESGSVRWLFEEKGVVTLRTTNLDKLGMDKEELELLIIDAGAEDIKYVRRDNEEFLEVYTKTEDLEKVKNALQEKNIEIESASVDLVPKNEIEATDPQFKEQIKKLFEALDEQNEVEEIYSNLRQ